MPSLALIYVTQRVQSGHLNRRSAQNVRYRLLDFCEACPANPKRVRKHHVERWMERPDLRPQYRRGRLSALRGFCKWAVSEGHMIKDPTLGVEMPKVPPQLPKRLTRTEAVALVDAVRGDPRSRLVVLLMLQLGLRRIEVARANVEDVDFAERTITVRGKGGDGKETATLPVDDETWRALTGYLATEGHTGGPLIRNRVRRHGRCSPSTISDLVRAGMVEAGIKKPGDTARTPHSCRHTAAHDLLEATGGDVYAVRDALRHASVRTTELYLRGSSIEVQRLRAVMGGRSYLR